MQVGAIHGRLLTAWSTAGVLGPVLVNYIREYEIAHGVAKADAYTTTMHIMAGLLVVGFDRATCSCARSTSVIHSEVNDVARQRLRARAARNRRQCNGPPLLAWALVGIPLAWGVWQVFKKSLDLFR